MSTIIREPNPGEPISANLIRAIVRAIKENRPIAGRGMTLKFGPNGTTFNANRAAASYRDSKSQDIGCYAIESLKHSETDPAAFTVRFKNEIFRVGGRTYGTLKDPGEGTEFAASGPCIVYLEISAEGGSPATSIKYCESLTKLKVEEDDEKKFLFPLYAFNAAGLVACDLRTAPSAAMFEFSM